MITHHFETTLFKGDIYINSAQIYDYLTSNLSLNVKLIANEVNEVGKTHFHVYFTFDLSDDDYSEFLDLIYQQYGILARVVKDLDALIVYFTKDGRYVAYNGFNVSSFLKTKNNVWIDILLDIESFDKYQFNDNMKFLIRKYGNVIVRNYYAVSKIMKGGAIDDIFTD